MVRRKEKVPVPPQRKIQILGIYKVVVEKKKKETRQQEQTDSLASLYFLVKNRPNPTKATTKN